MGLEIRPINERNAASNLDLARVTDLRPRDDSGFSFWYTFRIKCTSCRDIHPNPIGISRFVCHLLYHGNH